MRTELIEQERISMLIGYCGGKAKFGKRLGLSPQSVSSWLSRGTYNANTLSEGFPEVSSDWLLRGTGPMLEADAKADEQFALDTLGITREQLDSIRTSTPAPVPAASPAGNKESVPVRTHEDVYSLEDTPTLSVAESTATSQCSSLDMITIPRAVLNALTQQLDVKDAQIDTILRQLQQHEKK